MNKVQSRIQTRSYILWSLKLDGNIEESGKGGVSALSVLRENISKRGGTAVNNQALSATLYNLEKEGRLRRARDGLRVYAIRLVDKHPTEPNPFAGSEIVRADEPKELTTSLDLSVVPTHLSEEVRALPIGTRVRLQAEIANGIADDLARFKSGVVEGL